MRGLSYKQMTLTSIPTTRSPISYPGSKRAIKKKVVDELVKLGASRHGLCSPFMGGGSVELLAASRMKVYTSDLFGLLVNFWVQLKKNPAKLAYRVYDILGTIGYNTVRDGTEQTPECIESLRDVSRLCFQADTPLDRAAYFYIRNKTCYAGTMFKNSRIKTDEIKWDRSICVLDYRREISETMIDGLADFYTDAEISHKPYQEAIEAHPNCVFYCDPPYFGVKHRFYGVDGHTQKDFDPYEFYDFMTEGDKRFIVSYDNNPMIRRLWSRYFIREANWTYGMTGDGNRNIETAREILIYSDDPEDLE